MRIFLTSALVAMLLTILTQLGGVAWLIAHGFRRRMLAFVILYLAFWGGALALAPTFGRVAISCTGSGALQMQSWFYCLLNRNYVTPELATVLEDAANEVARTYPGTTTLMLDGSFPFLDGFALLPHLSHSTGAQADLAFYYRSDGAYQPGLTRSPIGYFAFESGTDTCPPARPTLRWDLAALQGLWRDATLDSARLKQLVRALSADARVGKIFLEPHLVASLGLGHPKVRFQGCRAARHDDHVHVQL